ncbi:transcription factor E2F3 isoform X2 [Solea solea]|uniref:transcription factor E2F3 isoform X2 n=1 Tax=Solea solea TaxID=90069 RepID=UPI00272A9665|nr:transcription factor E2F3 isoform X2 [Solea solea]
MFKCIVSACPNRIRPVNRIIHRPPKRFFNFPKDPATVKVWLAALRELDKHDGTEQHVICEDHFLPEDISNNKVKKDAIPIMPPYLDAPLGLVSPWRAETSEEEEEEEEEEWTTGGCGDDDDEGGDHPQQGSGAGPENPPAAQNSSAESQEKQSTADDRYSRYGEWSRRRGAESQEKQSTADDRYSRYDMSWTTLTRRFLEMLLTAPDGSLDVWNAAESLQTCKQRVSDLTNILVSFKLLQRDASNTVKWTGKVPISSLLQNREQKIQRELKKLKQVEDTLDGLIKSCAQQLFDMTDDVDSSASAYVTHHDISQLRVLQEQTLVIIRAPEETKLEVPAPTEDSVQIHLKAGRGPIMIMTCEVGSGEAVTFDPGQTGSGFFLTLEESRVRTTSLHKEC